MSIYLILILAVIIGATILAHEMGKDYGYEHGYNDARDKSTCTKCRMSEGYDTIRTRNTNQKGGMR